MSEVCINCGNEMECLNGKKWYCRKCGTLYDYWKNGKYHAVIPEFMRWKDPEEEPPIEDVFYFVSFPNSKEKEIFHIEILSYDFKSKCFKTDPDKPQKVWYRELGPNPNPEVK